MACIEALSTFSVSTSKTTNCDSCWVKTTTDSDKDICLLFLSGSFGLIFVDQTFWQCGTAAKPSHSVWGFITGGLVWFALAFVASYAIGMAYLAFSVQQGYHMVNNDMAVEGLTAIAVGQRVLEDTSSYLMFTVIMIAVITTVSGEVTIHVAIYLT